MSFSVAATLFGRTMFGAVVTGSGVATGERSCSSVPALAPAPCASRDLGRDERGSRCQSRERRLPNRVSYLRSVDIGMRARWRLASS